MLRNQKGQGMVEYILIVALVVVAAIGVWKIFGTKVSGLIDRAGDKIEAVNP